MSICALRPRGFATEFFGDFDEPFPGDEDRFGVFGVLAEQGSGTEIEFFGDLGAEFLEIGVLAGAAVGRRSQIYLPHRLG